MIEAPKNLDAERSVLGALLLHPDAVADVAFLRGRDFFLRRHELVFDAIVASHRERGLTDPITVGEQLSRQGQLEEVGGHVQLLDLFEESQATAAHASLRSHGEIVRDKARTRKAADAAAEFRQAALDGAVDLDELVAKLFGQIEATQPAPKRRVREAGEVAKAPTVERLVAMCPQTGLVVMHAPPTFGKSLTMLDLMLRGACGLAWLGHELTPFSSMFLAGEGDHGARIRAWLAANPAANFIDGRYAQVVDGVPNLTIGAGICELRSLIRAAIRKHGHAPSLLIVDTFAVATAGCDENDAGAVGTVAAALIAIAREFDLLVVAIHHPRKAQPGAPRGGIDAMRGSSALAGAADVVLGVTKDGDIHEIVVDKARDSESGQPLRYTIRGMATGRTLADGKPEFAPIVVMASDTQAKPDQAAVELEEEGRIVDALRDLGSATRIDTVVRKAQMKTGKGRAAFDRAQSKGRIKVDGSYRRTVYTAPECAAHTPHTPARGAGRLGAATDGAPGIRVVEGREGAHGAPNEDDGMPEKPKGRRRRVRK